MTSRRHSQTVNVGSVSTQTGALAGDFSSMVPGVRAYFDYIARQAEENGTDLRIALAEELLRLWGVNRDVEEAKPVKLGPAARP